MFIEFRRIYCAGRGIIKHSIRRKLAGAGCVMILLAQAASAQYIVRPTQIDSSSFPTIRVYVSITDSKGEAIPDSIPVRLSLYENDSLVSQEVLSQGTISSVLVLDTSGSMGNDQKLQKAKEAAINYVDMAPPNYKIAIVGFSSSKNISVIGSFDDDKNALRSHINNLSAGGTTALQDGVGVALDLLRSRRDRKVLIVLTDGQENDSKNYSNDAGYRQLITRSEKENCSISTIGLGKDVDERYLKSYEATGGRYFFSPQPDQLREVFASAAKAIQTEKVFEYVTLNKDADGLRKRISIQGKVGDQILPSQDIILVSPGLIPHVRGNHLPYFTLLFLLAAAPTGFSLASYCMSVRRFRSTNVERLQPGSDCIGKRDPNVGSSGQSFSVGDLVIVCPACRCPHYVSSWRMINCRCYLEPEGKGGYCYQRKLPEWLRRKLDSLSNCRRNPETGRTWLCRCAGDNEGY